MRKLLAILLLIPNLALAAAPTRQFNYVSHAVIDPSQNNANENALYSYLQNGVDTYSAGSIDNTDISSSAAISYTKLNLLGSITNADISGSAAIDYSKLSLSGSITNSDLAGSIADSKLLTISTAGKVNISALTVSSQAQGDIIYASGASTWARLGAGTSGQVLKTQGAGTNPVWTTPAMSLVSVTNVSAAVDTGNISITSTKQYYVKVVITSMSSTDNMALRFNNDSTSNNYGYVVRGFDVAATGANLNSNMSAALILMLPSSSAQTNTNQYGYIDFYIPIQSTSGGRFMYPYGKSYGFVVATTNGGAYADWYGAWTNSAAATSFRITSSGGVVTWSGTVYLYEISTS